MDSLSRLSYPVAMIQWGEKFDSEGTQRLRGSNRNDSEVSSFEELVIGGPSFLR